MYGPRAGVGVSTVALSLARSLVALGGSDVGLAELDPRVLRARAIATRDAERSEGAEGKRETVRSAAQRSSAPLPGIDAWLERRPDGIWILAAPARQRTPTLGDAKAVIVTLDALRETFAFSVAELEHQMNERTLAALDAADRLLLVTDPTVSSIRGTQRILRLCRRLNYPDEKLCVVVNRYDSAIGVSAADVVAALKRELYWKIPDLPAEPRGRRNGSESGAAPPGAGAVPSELAGVYLGLAEKLREELG